MGSIEKELRGATPSTALSTGAFRVAIDAMFYLFGQWGDVGADEDWADIMSEAIEAAEALGL